MKRRLCKQQGTISAIADKSSEPNWDKETVILSLKYIQHEKECFSDWNKKRNVKVLGFQSETTSNDLA